MTLEQDQARARARARARIKANAQPADDGVNPVPVAEDQPGSDWLRQNYPTVFTGGQEFSRGMAEGLGSLPNVVPNVVNSVNELYHLHTDPTGTPPPEPVMNQWWTPRGKVEPVQPGWEGVRRYGQITGAAAPAGWPAMLAGPPLATAGGWVGDVVDNSLDPNDQHKWQRTLETAAPMAVRLGAPLVKYAPTSGNVGLGTMLTTGSPTKALLAAGTNLAVKAGSEGLKNIPLSQMFRASVAPLAVDDPNRRYGGPR